MRIGSEHDAPRGDMDENFAAHVLKACQARDGAPAIWAADDVDSVSHAEFCQRVRLRAASLAEADVVPGDRVALIQHNTVGHIVDWFAALYAGALVVDVSFLLGAEEQSYILSDAAPRVLLPGSGALVQGDVPDGVRVLGPVTHDAGSTPIKGTERTASDPAVIAYTSGTTGLPKGVVHTHGALMRQVDLLHRTCGYDSGWTAYVAIPLFSMHGFLPQVAATLAAGGDVVLDDKFDAGRLAAVSRRHHITYTTLSSPMVPRLLALPEEDRPDFSSIRMVSCGGGPLHPDLKDEFTKTFGVHLTQGYACTEVVGAFVMDIAGDAPPGAAGRVFPETGVPVVRIVDSDGRPAAIVETGEIQFHRDFVMAGYWGSAGADDGVVTTDGWYATGDIGFLDDLGFLSVVDRKKDVIIRGGFNIYSAEIERVLTQHHGVAEAVVLGRPDASLGEVPVAFVVLDDDSVAVAELCDYVRDRLGPLKQVASVAVVGYDDLPRNGLGKVLKSELRAIVAASAGG